jgi:hypothetical protein
MNQGDRHVVSHGRRICLLWQEDHQRVIEEMEASSVEMPERVEGYHYVWPGSETAP